MLSTKYPYRRHAISRLKLFASADELINWQREIGVYARDELICSWSDIYFPAHDPTHYNPGVFERGQQEWLACFHEAEIEAMAEFHAVFEAKPHSLLEGWVDIHELVAMPEWKVLAEAAQRALRAFHEPADS